MSEQGPEKYYKFKITIAWLVAPIYVIIILCVFLSSAKLLGIPDSWSSKVFNYLPLALKESLVVMAVWGIILIIPKAVRSLNREEKVPFPGFTWLNNPLYSASYASMIPSENVAELISEGESLKTINEQLVENLNICNILGNAHCRTITHISKLHRSLRNRLMPEVEFHLKDFLNEIATEICSTMVDTISDKSCSIMIIEDDKLKIWGQNRIEPDNRTTTSFEKGVGFAGSIWQNGEYDIVNNIDEDPRFKTLNSKIRYYNSIIGVPIVYLGEVIGVICVQSEKTNAFIHDDEGILQSFSELIILTLTINNALNIGQYVAEAAATSD